jgi:hypothetical protein
MTNTLKEFIEKRVHLLDENNFRQLFLEAYGESLMTSEVQELHNMLLESDIIDSTEIRNECLYKVIEENLEFIRLRHPTDLNTRGMSVAETYVIQFLRRYLNNCFGFLEGQAVQFMVENQDSLNIRLRKVTQGPAAMGAGMYSNYHIEYI